VSNWIDVIEKATGTKVHPTNDPSKLTDYVVFEGKKIWFGVGE